MMLSDDRAYRTEEADVDIGSLLEAIYRQYGYDFRNYTLASLKRRIWKRAWEENVGSIPELQEKLLHESACMERFLLSLSLNSTPMFDDPGLYLTCRRKIIPLLRTYPFVRIWQVGCSTGEGVYSMAILLWEEGLHERTRIYATDTNETVLQQARAGVFPVEFMPGYGRNYRQAGGRRFFSEYYTTQGNTAVFHPQLQKNVVWATHNLVTDASFNEFHLILCRNILMDFNLFLQNHVNQLLYESLVRLGVLALGKEESLPKEPWGAYYEVLDAYEKLYRKVN